MTLRCLAYRALDKFRHTRLATRLFYRGVPVRTLRPACTVEGIVVRAVERAKDGDVCFNIRLDDGSERHVEVTPCASDRLRQRALDLRDGWSVRVSGEERYDPAHVGDGGNLGTNGWLEIHPCTAIEVLTWAQKSSKH